MEQPESHRQISGSVQLIRYRVNRERLVALRALQDWTQEEAARRIGVESRTVIRFENNEKIISADRKGYAQTMRTLGYFAKSYKVSVSSLLSIAHEDKFAVPSEPYVNRSEELEALGTLIETRNPIAIVAPRKYGKSTFIRHILSCLTLNITPQPVMIQCDIKTLTLSNSSGSIAEFFEILGSHISSELPALEAHSIQSAQTLPGSPKARLTAMVRSLLASSARMVVLTFERADALYDGGQHYELFTLLRSWAAQRRDPAWANLRIIVSVEVPVLLLEQPVQPSAWPSSLFELSKEFCLPPLGTEQLARLATAHGVVASDQAIATLDSFLGGHPQLWSQALTRARAMRCALDELADGDIARIFEQDLLRLVQRLTAYQLLDVVQSMNSGTCLSIANDQYARLYRLGVIRRSTLGGYTFTNRLFEENLPVLCSNKNRSGTTGDAKT